MANKLFFRFIFLCGMFSISMVAIAQPPRGPFVISPQVLSDKKVNHKNLITEGGHTWMNVKSYVNQTAQLLFK